MERTAAGLDDDRDDLELAVSAGWASRTPASQSSGAWNWRPGGRRHAPMVRARTYAIGPASAAVSCSDIQHVTISGGTR